VQRCLLIEDSLAGVEAGLAAGVQVVGYRLSDSVQDALSRRVLVISEFEELERVLSRERGSA
jgi:beta-phosphoglucomutase-like phosphatase (HAD superfamily)